MFLFLCLRFFPSQALLHYPPLSLLYFPLCCFLLSPFSSIPHLLLFLVPLFPFLFLIFFSFLCFSFQQFPSLCLSLVFYSNGFFFMVFIVTRIICLFFQISSIFFFAASPFAVSLESSLKLVLAFFLSSALFSVSSLAYFQMDIALSLQYQ